MKLTTAQIRNVLDTLEEIGLYNQADNIINNLRNNNFNALESDLNNIVEAAKESGNYRIANKIELAMVREARTNPWSRFFDGLDELRVKDYIPGIEHAGRSTKPKPGYQLLDGFFVPDNQVSNFKFLRDRKLLGFEGKAGAAGPAGPKGDMGERGKRGKPGERGQAGSVWPGVAAGVGSGLLGVLGLGFYLNNKTGQVHNENGDVIPYSYLPPAQRQQYDMLAKRSAAGQVSEMSFAQDFVNQNLSNPNLKSERNWYDHAMNKSMQYVNRPNDKNFANNVIAIIKAQGKMTEEPIYLK